MKFPRAIILALVSALGVYAQSDSPTGPNAFTNTAFSITAGQPFTFTWNPSTPGTVSLILRSGASSNLNVVDTIAKNIPNSGTYTWTPSLGAVRGSDYTVEIRSDEDESATNYSAYFVLNSDNTVASTTASASSVSPLPSTISTASATASSTESGSSSSTESSSPTGTASTSPSSSASRTSSATDLQATAASSTSQAAGARATAMVGMLGAVALGAMVL